jgi:hypothetical protein
VHEVSVQPQGDAAADEVDVDMVGAVVEGDDAVAGYGPVDFDGLAGGEGEMAVDTAQRGRGGFGSAGAGAAHGGFVEVVRGQS